MAWRLPWRRETRQAAPYTDRAVSAAVAAAGGAYRDAEALGALEVAAGQWARAFASATVKPATRATAGVLPSCLATIGRELIRHGEAVFLIEVAAGRVVLRSAASWAVFGGDDPAAWEYQVDLGAPGHYRTLRRPAEAVIHCRYAVKPSRPWQGIGPLQWARQTGALAANLEQRLGEEAGAPVGSLVPVPESVAPTGDADPLAQLRGDLRESRGRLHLVETMASGMGDGRSGAPHRDWTPQRFGANPPASLDSLRGNVGQTVLAACGVPPALVGESEGTAQRESWRRFLHGSVQPVAGIVAEELGAKLDAPDLRLEFEALFASDLAGRARAFQSMVKAGMDPAKAAALAGLITE